MRSVAIQLLMSFVGTFSFSVLFNVRGKKLLLAGIGVLVLRRKTA